MSEEQGFEITFHDEKPIVEQLAEEGAGATPVWLYVWSGKPGPATMIPYMMVNDDEGNGFLQPIGPPQDVTVTE